MARRRKRKQYGRRPARAPGKAHDFEVRKRLVEQVVEHGGTVEGVARAFGVGSGTLSKWVRLYEVGGDAALRPKERKEWRRPESAAKQTKRKAVIAKRTEHP